MINTVISVIMLTYNRETLVRRAAESVLSQSFHDFEFIIVDNGSTDLSGQIADEYAARDSRVRVIHRERGNIGSGRNAGLDAARGEYIAFVDDDDWCEPDFLEFLYSLAVENDADVSICGAADKAFDEQAVMTAEEALITLMRRKKYDMAFPTKMFRRDLAKHIRFPVGDKFDDISQMHRLLAFAKRVAYHGLPKYTFYRHGNNNSAWTTNHELLTSDILDEYLRAYRERTELLAAMFPERAAAWRYFEWSFMISIVEKINRLGIAGCDTHLMAMSEELRANREFFLRSDFILDFEVGWVRQYIGQQGENEC